MVANSVFCVDLGVCNAAVGVINYQHCTVSLWAGKNPRMSHPFSGVLVARQAEQSSHLLKHK